MENNFNYSRIEQAISYLTVNFNRQPSLEEVAEALCLSPFHFQRLFTEWAGISPKKFLQFLTTEYLKTRLGAFDNLIDAAEAAGLSSQSRVYDLFVTLEAVTPQEYKEQGQGLQIEYGFHPTPFGDCLLAATERGICHLTFISETGEDAALEKLRTHWPNALLQAGSETTRRVAEQIFRPEAGTSTRLNLLVKGTNFQVKVWEALLNIPSGQLSTYQTIAGKIGAPKALQAVGSAIGANHIGYLIPCHRVIKKEGLIGGYRWGADRKRAILGWEMARYAS